MKSVTLVARLVVAEHASGMQREQIKQRAKRARDVFAKVNEFQRAFKLSAMKEFPWLHVLRTAGDG